MVKTLKDFLENRSFEYFSEKKTIETLMKKIGISDQKFTGIETTSKINDDRFYVIFNTIKDGHGNKGRHIIDVILDEPTWQQMMDVTFGAGCQCNTRIVIFDNAAELSDVVSNRETASKFASINNKFGVDTFVIAAHLTENREQDIIDISYNIEASQHHGYSIDYRRFPSKDEFEQAEFWMYFDEFLYFPPERIYDPNLWMNGSVFHFIDKGIDVFPIWTNAGFFMLITADNFRGHKILVKLVETKRNEIEKHFKDYKLAINRIPDTPVEIIVKFDERPFKDFISMSIGEKNSCGRKHRDIKKEFQRIFKKLIEDIDETDNRVGVKEVK